MLKPSIRRLTLYLCAGLFCFVLVSLWNSTQHLKVKTHESEAATPNTGQRFQDLHIPVIKPREELQKVRSEIVRQNDDGRVKSSAEKTHTKLDRAQKRRKNSRAKPTPVAVVVAKKKSAPVLRQATTVRPVNCSACFHTDFPVLMDQPEVCRGRGNGMVDMVFLVVSAPKNSGRRDAIRKTWASVTRKNTANLRHVFMVGTSTDSELMQVVKGEADLYRDVVVTGFHDSYRNLTLKVITSLRWFTTRCRKARFFMKVDDDVWINTAVMTSLLRNHSDFLQHGMGGRCSHTFRPRRGKGSKWYVPKYVYAEDRYPPYCQGLAYISSFTVAKRIVDVSVDVPFFTIEDVYIGMCLHRLGFDTRSLGKFKHNRNKDACQGQRPDVPSIHNVSPRVMMQLWKAECPAKDGVAVRAGRS